MVILINSLLLFSLCRINFIFLHSAFAFITIIFFIIYYISSEAGKTMAKEATLSPGVGIWAANVLLTVIGAFFLRQAYRDARLFDMDYYLVQFNKFKMFIQSKLKK